MFWTAYAICLMFQLLVNGVLTGRGLVTYSPHAIEGARLATVAAASATVAATVAASAMVAATAAAPAWVMAAAATAVATATAAA